MTDINTKGNLLPEFEPGKSGNPSGRPKGSGHKIINAIKIMQEQGFCPLLESIKMYKNIYTKDREKVQLLDMLNARYAATLKSIEMKGELGTSYALNVVFKDETKENA